MINTFNHICEFRAQFPGTKGNAIKTNDAKLDNVKQELFELQNWLEQEFQNHRNIKFHFDYSKGQSYFPSILHASILPPKQRVSNGIYVVICFDILGRGALVGCGESKTNPKGLNTLERSSNKNMIIDVDGIRQTTRYNDVFENPLEIYYPLTSEEQIKSHLFNSLDLCLYHLGLIKEHNLSTNLLLKTNYVFDFDPNSLSEAREIIARNIANRRGQKKFRESLLKAYNRKCAITNSHVIETLDAAHIFPYKGDSTNNIQNGVLLRTDIHTLFDLGLITIHPDKFEVIVSKRLLNSEYQKFNGQKIFLPKKVTDRPSKKSLMYHKDKIFEKE